MIVLHPVFKPKCIAVIVIVTIHEQIVMDETNQMLYDNLTINKGRELQ